MVLCLLVAEYNPLMSQGYSYAVLADADPNSVAHVLQVLAEVGRSCPALQSLYMEHDKAWLDSNAVVRSTSAGGHATCDQFDPASIQHTAAGCKELQVSSLVVPAFSIIFAHSQLNETAACLLRLKLMHVHVVCFDATHFKLRNVLICQ